MAVLSGENKERKCCYDYRTVLVVIALFEVLVIILLGSIHYRLGEILWVLTK